MTDYLIEQLKEMAPHRAILRAVECRLMAGVELVAPVLDVGTGDGHFASVAFEGAPIDVGIDPDADDLAEARSRHGVYRHLMRSSATALPFADESFRTIVCNSVLEHIPDLDSALREISRVLRAPDPASGSCGGTFAATMPSDRFAEFLLGTTLARRLGLKRLARAYGDWFNRISHHHHVHSPEEWARRLEAVGLIVDEATYYFSAAAHRRFDLSHYLGVPNLLTRRLFGRWVLFPGQMKPFELWLRRGYEEPLPEVGAYVFVRCRKA